MSAPATRRSENTVDITITNPDEEFGCPAYEGPLADAHTKLDTGLYTATDDATGDEVAFAVIHGDRTILVPIVDIDHVHTR